MSITGDIINVQKLELTDTFQTWFTKTNEIVGAVNPMNIYDLDVGSAANVTYGLSGTEYNGIKAVNVQAAYGVAVSTLTGGTFPWDNKVSLDISSISGDTYALTGNNGTAGSILVLGSEVDVDDYFVVLDRSDPRQGAAGTTKIVKARHILPRTINLPKLTISGDLQVGGDLFIVGAGSNILAGALSTSDEVIYLAMTGAGGTFPMRTESQLGNTGAGLIVGISGGTNKEFVWKYNTSSDKAYWAFNTNYGSNNISNVLVNSKFIARNFIEGNGATNNTFLFEAQGGSATRLWLTQDGSNAFFGLVKDSASFNVNMNAYMGGGATSVANILPGATSVYTGVTANAFIRLANVDMLDGAHATTGASAWTIPVTDHLGELRPDRHNASQVKRRFTQANHGLTTGQAVTIVPNSIEYSTTLWGTLTGAAATSSLLEAIGIVDRVISANEVSVTMKGHLALSANRLFGVGTPVTGQYYVLDWTRQGGLTTNTNIPEGYIYQPMFLALGGSAGIVYGNESKTILSGIDTVFVKGLIPIGTIQAYAGSFNGLTMGLSSGTVNVSDIGYRQNYLPCDGRVVSATGASGFLDLYNLIGVSYPMRGTVVSSDGDPFITIKPDRGTANLSSIDFGSGTVRIVKRVGTNSEYSKAYTSLTASTETITIIGAGITTEAAGLSSQIVVDLLTPKNGEFFFLPDMRGKSPFGEYAPFGARGENFNLGSTGGTSIRGQTGATASGNGGLFVNYLIRAREESDTQMLTGHNHDSRYLRKDTDIANQNTKLNLRNLKVDGQIDANLGIGRNPATDTSSDAFPIAWEKNGNYASWLYGSNSNTGSDAKTGIRLSNGAGNGNLYVEGKETTGKRMILQADSNLNGISILASNPNATTPITLQSPDHVISFNGVGNQNASILVRAGDSSGLKTVFDADSVQISYGTNANLISTFAREKTEFLVPVTFISGATFGLLSTSPPTTFVSPFVTRSSSTFNSIATFNDTATFNDGATFNNHPVVINNTDIKANNTRAYISKPNATAVAVTGNAVVDGSVTIDGNVVVAGNIKSATANNYQFIGHGTVPIGGIIMWSGTTVPDGWAICDGETVNGKVTPDLRGRFIVGVNNTIASLGLDRNTNFTAYNIGNVGGLETVTLTVAQTPAHTHSVSFTSTTITTSTAGAHRHNERPNSSGRDGDDSSGAVGIRYEQPFGAPWSHAAAGDHNHTFNANQLNSAISQTSVGGNQAHENRPPYYALAFIMRIK